jgi:5-methylcytosine-specific restriction endonuclease McrA
MRRFESGLPYTMANCPTCRDSFKTNRAASIHHKLSHGESIAKEESDCRECGSTFSYYPSDKKGIYCPECVDSGVGWTAARLTGSDNPNWNNKYNTFKEGSGNINWRGGCNNNYGSNWPSVRRTVLDRDDYKCQICGVMESDLSQSLHVHHKTPLSSFESSERANNLENLVTLCPSCHQKLERERDQNYK